jgi:4-hydroxybenzoate polyprenyltransferase
MKAWLQLLRLPNVFTAAADVTMGFLVTHGSLQPALQFALLVAASCLLYLSGMVLNDVFDAEVDARERPERPIPSGRVTLRAAAAGGFALLTSGLLVAWFAGFLAGDWRPGVVATLLALCIVAYDSFLKQTPLGPLIMGACRSLNILLGMSLAAPAPIVPSIRSLSGIVGRNQHAWSLYPNEWLIALGIGIYIAGVTLFARSDAQRSPRGQLASGLAILLGGMALLTAVPSITNFRPRFHIALSGWYLLWAALAMITARRCVLAIATPTPERVQAAVRHCVQSIIVLDAAVCVGYAGPMWGVAVLALLAPTLLLSGWLKAT